MTRASSQQRVIFTLMTLVTIKMLLWNGVSEVAFVNESTVGQVFISSQRNAVTDKPRQ